MRRIIFVALLSVSGIVFGAYEQKPEVLAFIDEMVSEHQFDRTKLVETFKGAQRKESILKAISRPAEKRLEWKGYRKIFMTQDRIEKGQRFMAEHKDVLTRAEKEFGVPAEIIVAIIGVETRYGSNKGSYRVLDALSTLGFDYPPRAKFFKKELKQAFLLAREQGFELEALVGSYAGAMGYGQFIPSSYRHYAIDYSGDGVADILNNPVDAIGSVANYFVKHKWKSGEPVALQTQFAGNMEALASKGLKPKQSLQQLYAGGVSKLAGLEPAQDARLIELQGADGVEHWVTLHNFYVITRYNHSHLYAMAVFQLSEAIGR